MKKFIAVPIVAVIAAVGAASAAGFAGGVSAGPIQSGDANDLACADSARVVEWGSNDHTNPPNVVNARIKFTASDCEGSAVHVIALTAGGTEQPNTRATPGLIQDNGANDYARVTFPTPISIADLNALRITVDPGYAGLSFLPIS